MDQKLLLAKECFRGSPNAMIDTHSHLYFDSYDEDRLEVMARNMALLDAVITVGVDESTSQKAITLSEKYPNMYAAVGLHPEEIAFPTDVLWVERSVSHKKVVAIGEIGLDYSKLSSEHDVESTVTNQKNAFRAQLEIALRTNLPVVIHSRDAFDDTLEILTAYKGSLRGVWHSFTGDVESMQKVIRIGFMIGINGIVTYTSAQPLQDAVSRVELSHLVLETDAPFLPPVPHRGERNEPYMVTLVAEKVASLRKDTVENVIAQTDKNAQKLFLERVL
ncbi:hydrolase TatD [candidate division WWE3 bacterium CG_4_9_14_3_um_filter_41_6]|uniref:Hydrolase TatD n=1 Tax=candidate division WWE3 bacterium CG_4_10_14_0_2_um_filter_41_14 TaxID=1975072 RepID=A0A2M7TGD5_UNCKA|nr:MAG: hydrolase TatD [candidate division WWE3 bacterium CG_4_10_14_0_2_um_filter_41_14]PJA38219.1 MAG: hydrolase TatD [candidate division WWE3 bacterium CG_4_9_14_3_um_filter_41_6]